MKVIDLMTADVLTASPDENLKVAARRMVRAGVSGLPVVEGGRLSYFILVANNGGLDATGVVLTDTLDGNVS